VGFEDDGAVGLVADGVDGHGDGLGGLLFGGVAVGELVDGSDEEEVGLDVAGGVEEPVAVGVGGEVEAGGAELDAEAFGLELGAGLDAEGPVAASGLAAGVLDVDVEDGDGVHGGAGEGVDAGGGLDGDLAQEGGLAGAFFGGEDDAFLVLDEAGDDPVVGVVGVAGEELVDVLDVVERTWSGGCVAAVGVVEFGDGAAEGGVDGLWSGGGDGLADLDAGGDGGAEAGGVADDAGVLVELAVEAGLDELEEVGAPPILASCLVRVRWSRTRVASALAPVAVTAWMASQMVSWWG
jgi:hypothetical protein